MVIQGPKCHITFYFFIYPFNNDSCVYWCIETENINYNKLHVILTKIIEDSMFVVLSNNADPRLKNGRLWLIILNTYCNVDVVWCIVTKNINYNQFHVRLITIFAVLITNGNPRLKIVNYVLFFTYPLYCWFYVGWCVVAENINYK